MGVHPRESSTRPSSLCVKRCRKCMFPIVSHTLDGGQTWCCAAHTRAGQHQRSFGMAPSQHRIENAAHEPPNPASAATASATTHPQRRDAVQVSYCGDSGRPPLSWKIDTPADTASNAVQALRARRSHFHAHSQRQNHHLPKNRPQNRKYVEISYRIAISLSSYHVLKYSSPAMSKNLAPNFARVFQAPRAPLAPERANPPSEDPLQKPHLRCVISFFFFAAEVILQSFPSCSSA